MFDLLKLLEAEGKQGLLAMLKQVDELANHGKVNDAERQLQSVTSAFKSSVNNSQAVKEFEDEVEQMSAVLDAGDLVAVEEIVGKLSQIVNKYAR